MIYFSENTQQISRYSYFSSAKDYPDKLLTFRKSANNWLDNCPSGTTINQYLLQTRAESGFFNSYLFTA
jgi:hypothetical protein